MNASKTTRVIETKHTSILKDKIDVVVRLRRSLIFDKDQSTAHSEMKNECSLLKFKQ